MRSPDPCRRVGRCHFGGTKAARIWIRDRNVRAGGWPLILLHELLHASLSWRGQDTQHNADPWCAEVVRISAALGCPVSALPVRTKRTGKAVARHVEPGHLTQAELGSWPHFTADRLREFLTRPTT